LQPKDKQRLSGRQSLLLCRIMIIKVLVLVAACIASGEALNCLSCEENCVATPGRKYDSIACDQGVKFCHLLISNGKPTSMGCDTNGLKSYPADYAAVEGDDHKRCSEGQGTDARPASGQINCLCDTDDCNANQYAAPGAAPKVSGSILFAGVLGLVMARIWKEIAYPKTLLWLLTLIEYKNAFTNIFYCYLITTLYFAGDIEFALSIFGCTSLQNRY